MADTTSQAIGLYTQKRAADLYRQGQTIPDISSQLNVSPLGIYYALVKNGILKGGNGCGKFNEVVGTLDRALPNYRAVQKELMRLYEDCGGLTKLTRELNRNYRLNISTTTTAKLLRYYKIDLHKPHSTIPKPLKG